MPEVFITCAVTGAGDTVGKSDKVPFTPEAIASDVIAAAGAGALLSRRRAFHLWCAAESTS